MRRKALFWTAGLLAPLMVVALPMLMVVAMLSSMGGDDDAADDSPSACTKTVADTTETDSAGTTGSGQLANGLKVAQAFADAGYTKESAAGVGHQSDEGRGRRLRLRNSAVDAEEQAPSQDGRNGHRR